MSISAKWKQPEKEYRKLSKGDRKVGNFQIVIVDNNLYVANIIGQNGLRYNFFGVPAVNYAAIEVALGKIAKFADSTNLNLHAPRIGCFRAGGNWEVMEVIINRAIRNYNCDINIYDLKENTDSY